jgi:hypothetical protein
MRPFENKILFILLLGLLVTTYQTWRSMKKIPWNTMNENQEQGIAPAPSKQKTRPTQVPLSKIKNSEFPVTNFNVSKFTPNVMDLIKLVSLKRVQKCAIRFHISVNAKGMVNKIKCHPLKNVVSLSWCKVLHDQFTDAAAPRPLPGNVTFGISDKDYTDYHIRNNKGCFASSSPQGRFAVPNFLDISEMAEHASYKPTTVPWQERSRIPIWRGTLWHNMGDLNMTDASSSSTIVEDLSQQSSRAKAVLVSKQHPDLLATRVFGYRNGKRRSLLRESR